MSIWPRVCSLPDVPGSLAGTFRYTRGLKLRDWDAAACAGFAEFVGRAVSVVRVKLGHSRACVLGMICGT